MMHDIVKGNGLVVVNSLDEKCIGKEGKEAQEKLKKRA